VLKNQCYLYGDNPHTDNIDFCLKTMFFDHFTLFMQALCSIPSRLVLTEIRGLSLTIDFSGFGFAKVLCRNARLD